MYLPLILGDLLIMKDAPTRQKSLDSITNGLVIIICHFDIVSADTDHHCIKHVANGRKSIAASPIDQRQ